MRSIFFPISAAALSGILVMWLLAAMLVNATESVVNADSMRRASLSGVGSTQIELPNALSSNSTSNHNERVTIGLI